MGNLFKRKQNVVKYTINSFTLTEENLYSNCVRTYDLSDTNERMVFQVHLKHFSRYKMDVIINTYDLYLLHNLKWL